MEARLIGQVLVNLLDNAVQHPPQAARDLRICRQGHIGARRGVFRGGQGMGSSGADLPRVFQMFYTTLDREADAQRSVGCILMQPGA